MKVKKGFSLIEVIIALAVFMIIIIPIFSLTLGTTKITKQSEDKLKASAIGQEAMEKLKNGNIHDNLFGSEKKEKEYKKDDFNVKIFVEPTEYKFKELDMDKAYKDIKYDEEIDVDSYKYKNKTLEVKNDEQGKDEKNIKVKLSGNNNVNVSIENRNINSALNIYFLKDSGCSCDYTIKEIEGKVKIFSNLINDENNNKKNYLPCRLYKIKVMVSKKGENLQNIEGYRTFLK
ncbi:type IV pilus modification PilV family protein [Clostridium novyi]|uniref:type IV pilus modification PilV family protein n=1 Tax=Clostridium novyi TaxID=1542 RepID=UPI00057D7F34|nr:prepilin-type N-terminal cleavage/methylation domain-containing protein [Clostridium novyi]